MSSITRVPPSISIINKKIEVLKEEEARAETMEIQQCFEWIIYHLEDVKEKVMEVTNNE